MTEHNGKNILVVDDSSTMRMLLKMTIKHVLPGISVTEAVDGVDAQEKVKEKSFDIVITDIVMPNMGGFELVRWIKESVSSELPVIMVTTHGEEESRSMGESLGVEDYLTKPVDGTQLKNVVSRLLYLE
jgi:DNA-binding response OmpR family regulator